MQDVIDVIKERRLNGKESGPILEKFGEKNYRVLYHEIKLIETQYLEKWEKFSNDKAYTEMFLAMSACLSVLYLKFDQLNRQMIRGVRPLLNEQHRLLLERNKLEEKYENSSETVKEMVKIQNFKNDLLNKQTCEERKMLLPESISSLRQELKIARREFLELWKKYTINFKLEKEFLKSSNKYARLLSKVNTLETKIREWRKTKPYRQMLRESYTRHSILEDKLLNNGAHD